jgi:hypothetical protein
MDIVITRAVIILQSYSADSVSLETTIPDPRWPYTGNLCLKFEVAKDDGVEFVKKHFNIEPEIVDVRRERDKFSE